MSHSLALTVYTSIVRYLSLPPFLSQDLCTKRGSLRFRRLGESKGEGGEIHRRSVIYTVRTREHRNKLISLSRARVVVVSRSR